MEDTKLKEQLKDILEEIEELKESHYKRVDIILNNVSNLFASFIKNDEQKTTDIRDTYYNNYIKRKKITK